MNRGKNSYFEFRVLGVKISGGKRLKAPGKEDRGTLDVCSTSDVCAVSWVGNKVVLTVSNHLTHKLVRAKKVTEEVPQPNIICQYNQHMGGVVHLNVYLNDNLYA